jgi:hypothetical protein
VPIGNPIWPPLQDKYNVGENKYFQLFKIDLKPIKHFTANVAAMLDS